MPENYIPIDKHTVTFQALQNQIEISKGDEVVDRLTGISLIPIVTQVHFSEVQKNFIRKDNSNKIDILDNLHNGNYFVNITNYTLGELSLAAEILSNKWLEEVWEFIATDSTKFETEISMTEEGIIKFLLQGNKERFQASEDIKNYCSKTGLKIESFVVPAKFSSLEIMLAKIKARLEAEIFFFRRKLFTELFNQKLKRKVSVQLKDGIDIPQTKIELVNAWISERGKELEMIQKYVKTPYTFEDSEQYLNYESLEKFTENKILWEPMVSETIFWIRNFPAAKKRFIRAVDLFNDEGDARDCLDNLRLSLELLLKGILNNKKSLEKQLPFIAEYQKELGLRSEIRNTFRKLLDYFSKFQNEYAKHNLVEYSEHELEFIYGLTMLFIRMLLKPNPEFNSLE